MANLVTLNIQRKLKSLVRVATLKSTHLKRAPWEPVFKTAKCQKVHFQDGCAHKRPISEGNFQKWPFHEGVLKTRGNPDNMIVKCHGDSH